jgi:hypothetical protein
VSRISEFEPRRRKFDDREEGRYGSGSRRSWPTSAWLVAGTMIALNLALGAFVVKNELNRGTFRGEQHGPVGVAPSLKPASPAPAAPIVEAPKVETQADAQASQSPLPDQSSKPDAVSAPAAKTDNRNTRLESTRVENRESPRLPLKTGAASTRPVKASVAGTSKTAAGSGNWAEIRRNSLGKPYPSEPFPQARFAAPQTYPSQTPAPVYPAVHTPAPSSASGAADNSSALVASVRTPTVGAPSPADSSRKVTPPAATGPVAKKAQPALDLKADQTQKQPIRVASVGLPRMDKGLVVPKTPVGTPSPVIEVVRRPQGPKVEVENCGGNIVIPCPTLHKRPLGGTPEGDRW